RPTHASAAGLDRDGGRRPRRSARRRPPKRPRRHLTAGVACRRNRRCGETVVTKPTGLAGRLAAAFIHSKLTPLVIVASLLLGVYAVIALPREEEPQIIVPMVDVFVELPGASPTEVEQRLTRPLEQMVWEIPGVEYVYSTSSAAHAMLVVRFLVGEDEERALVRLNQKL